MPTPNLLSGGGACCENPLVTYMVIPSISEFMPMVVTSELTRSSATNAPFTAPTPSPIASASATKARVSGAPASELGNAETLTAENDMMPATDRSSPRCWITRCWPIEATARTAKNGNINWRALTETVLGATRPPTRMRTAVAIATTSNRDSGFFRPLYSRLVHARSRRRRSDC